MGMIVLLIDDSAVMRKMVGRTLGQTGLEISETLEAGNGKEALAIAESRAKDISLMLCDWNMPEMNGLEFVKAARQIYLLKDTPIIMVTTEASIDMIKQAKDAGATEYVTKPFTPEKLKEKVTMAIAKKGAG